MASDELIRVVDEGLEQAQKSKAQLDTDLETLEKVLQTVPKASFLICGSRRGLCTGWCNKANSCH